MFKERLQKVRNLNPLIHNITNYVTANDCANILLACGASPIMADDIEEVEEITSICSGLNINIGTLNQRTIPAMIKAGKKANKLGHPVILDPVGVGASKLRCDTALKLIEEVKFTAIRGNISEIKVLALGKGSTKGVDADIEDKISDSNLHTAIKFAKEFSEKVGAVIAITGPIDIVADKNKAYVIRNGNVSMSKITGTGCMVTAMTSAYISANKDNFLEAVAASISAMGLCGELAHSRLKERDGNVTYRNYIIDEVFNLTGDKLEKGAKYKEY
ncbi:hydroxyethylthiazole kinase [Clostridium felsineum]|uniref:hydroxyethylthiazole kinase n=1 Tax=Clostridium felsineum TaxID=36839 RepID=UPI00214DCF13|nr:hydroxyethylthiazole kinase [Clostridium felsineum]MCR3757975.1 hydroxyethylthiazole kinase [Clostridium felsineum]